jgi:hypothetical protein
VRSSHTRSGDSRGAGEEVKVAWHDRWFLNYLALNVVKAGIDSLSPNSLVTEPKTQTTQPKQDTFKRIIRANLINFTSEKDLRLC